MSLLYEATYYRNKQEDVDKHVDAAAATVTEVPLAEAINHLAAKTPHIDDDLMRCTCIYNIRDTYMLCVVNAVDWHDEPIQTIRLYDQGTEAAAAASIAT